MKTITNAYVIAEHAHACWAPDNKPQLRKYTGEPYIVHPVRVAIAAASFMATAEPFKTCPPADFIAAAFLHDVLEDTTYPAEYIEDRCGQNVLRIVRELTNPSKGSTASRAQRKQQDRYHLACVSPEAKALKMLDRTDNVLDMRRSVSAPQYFDVFSNEFAKLYCDESQLLLDAIGQDVAGCLSTALGTAIKQLRGDVVDAS